MTTNLRRIKVWDKGTRIFHWVNAASVLLLIFLGTLILNADVFAIKGEGKVLLKAVHAYVGYLFCLNLLWRMVWGFIGNHYARWGQLLPFGKSYLQALKDYSAALLSGKPQSYVGHNPLGRLIIAMFFLLFIMQMITGLVVAGTDLYLPPFGHYCADWVTGGDADRLAALVPGDKSAVVPDLYQSMRDFRKPFISLHEFGFFVICALVVVHLVGVVFTEVKEKNGLVSAMITGEKVVAGKTVDAAHENNEDVENAAFNDGG